MADEHSSAELIQLTVDAETIDKELAELQPVANASIIGSAERRRFSELRDKSVAAWQRVLEYVIALKSITDDLRQPLPEEEE